MPYLGHCCSWQKLLLCAVRAELVGAFGEDEIRSVAMIVHAVWSCVWQTDLEQVAAGWLSCLSLNVLWELVCTTGRHSVM